MARHFRAGHGDATELKKKASSNTLVPTLANLASYLDAEFGQHGVAIALVSAGQISYQLHGFADLAAKIPVSKETLFEIGSVTKPLVALAALRQVHAGTWQLEQTVNSLSDAPQLAEHRYNLLQLLQHRSGLPRLPGNLATDAEALRNPYLSYSVADMLAAAAQTPLQETQFTYSNFGYGLLGYLVAQRNAKPLAQVLQQQVFTPLAMHSAAVNYPGAQYPRLAQGYALGGIAVEHWQFDAMAGAGAVVASIEDMAAMLSTLFSRRSEDAVLQQWLRAYPQAEPPLMSAGWMVQDAMLWHGGQTAGFSAMVVFDPAQATGVVILSNVAMPLTTAGFALLRQLLQQPATEMTRQDTQKQ